MNGSSVRPAPAAAINEATPHLCQARAPAHDWFDSGPCNPALRWSAEAPSAAHSGLTAEQAGRQGSMSGVDQTDVGLPRHPPPLSSATNGLMSRASQLPSPLMSPFCGGQSGYAWPAPQNLIQML